MWKWKVWYRITTNGGENSKYKQQQTLQKLSGIHKLDKASKVHKCLATADVEVRNFRKIRFSPVKLKVILRIVNAVLNGLRTTQFYRPFNYPPDKKFIRWIAAKHRLS
jgi:hypothetical protein